jgi:hypothetical protein
LFNFFALDAHNKALSTVGLTLFAQPCKSFAEFPVVAGTIYRHARGGELSLFDYEAFKTGVPLGE